MNNVHYLDLNNFGLIDNPDYHSNAIGDIISAATNAAGSMSGGGGAGAGTTGGATGGSGVPSASDIAQGVSTVSNLLQSLPKNQNKQNLKAACGAKPLGKKKQAAYQACVQNYQQNQGSGAGAGSGSGSGAGMSSSPYPDPSQTYTPPPSKSKMPIIIGISAVVLLVGGFLAYKKFKPKAAIAG